jgi:hypothetical protein
VKMKDLPIYFVPFGLLVVASFLYKVGIDSKIKNPQNSESIFSIIAFRKYGLETLLPRRTRLGDEKERKLRIKANIALIVFYGSFITILVLSKLLN